MAKKKVYKVIRVCDGIQEERFRGTEAECKEWISHRGDTVRCYYMITDPVDIDE